MVSEGWRLMHTPREDRYALSEMRPTWSHCMQLNSWHETRGGSLDTSF